MASYSMLKHKLKTIATVGTGGVLVFFGIGLYKSNEKLYKNVVMPLVHMLDAETAHRLGVLVAKYGFFTDSSMSDTGILKSNIWNRTLQNPIGLAAGFDKNGEAIGGCFKMGFGFVEIGSVTPEPQPGNPKPRVFRLTEDNAVINRYGFNSDGHEDVYKRVLATKREGTQLLGINLGKNKTSLNAATDYVKGIHKFGPIADFIVINISSPNTPGLRDMQKRIELEQLLDGVVSAANEIKCKTPILIKIAPDLTISEMKDIVDVALSKGIDGIVVSNTTITRPSSLKSPVKNEQGGLSGTPLKDISTKAIEDIYKLSNGKIPIIGVGGISSGEDAYEKICAGASIVELYTAFVYEGPPIVAKIKRELDSLLRRDGFQSISDAIGANHRK